MFYGNTRTERITRYYDLLNQSVCIKKERGLVLMQRLFVKCEMNAN